MMSSMTMDLELLGMACDEFAFLDKLVGMVIVMMGSFWGEEWMGGWGWEWE